VLKALKVFRGTLDLRAQQALKVFRVSKETQGLKASKESKV
jgi:hypothetical protein